MNSSMSNLARGLAAAMLLTIAAQPASAACTKLGFTVNDFGKDGPTKDAKGLLDKYIAKWAADHKIAKYNTGPKDVKCELFLNLIVVDEHTCRAEATVCWDGPPVTPVIKAEGAPDAKPAAATKAPAVKRAAVPAASPAAPTAAPAAAPAKPAPKAAAAPAASPVVTPIETGTLPAVVKPAIPAAPAAAPVAPVAPKAVAAEPAVAEQALAAAQKAAAAAERAAAAAERAAAAAQAAEKVNAPAAAKP